MKKKTVAVITACTVALGCAIGGTMAWLTDTTDEVVNTFTIGDINIDLSESTGEEYRFVPGDTLAKDPVVTVVRGSEPCWLFIKVDEENNQYAELEGDIIIWNVRTGADEWTVLEGVDNVWYRQVPADAAKAGELYYVLTAGEKEGEKKGHVAVNGEVTKEMVEGIQESKPALTFTAYAIQTANLTDQDSNGTVDANDAWKLINPGTGTETP